MFSIFNEFSEAIIFLLTSESLMISTSAGSFELSSSVSTLLETF